jgi:hypothetical protein
MLNSTGRTGGRQGGDTRLQPPRMSPEFRLLALASCRAGSGSDAPLAAPDGLDWDYLIRLGRRHRILGLLHAGLKSGGVRPPAEVAKLLEAEANAIAVNELWTAAETLRLQKALRSGGVEPMILKGVAVAMLAFGRLGLRYNHDIDILVRPQDVAAGLRILRGQGYRDADGEGGGEDGPSARWLALHKDVALAHESGRGVVELHWRLFNNPWVLGGAHPTGSPVRLAGSGVIQTLPPDLNLVYLCAHGAEHAWERLKWLLDVHALVSRMPRDALLELYASARARNLHRAVAQALLLCSQLFGLPIPQEVARSRRDLRVRILEAVALRTLLGSGDRELTDIRFGSTPKSISHYLRSDGWGYWRAEMAYDMSDVSGAPPPPGVLRRLGPAGRFLGWAGRHLDPRRGGR